MLIFEVFLVRNTDQNFKMRQLDRIAK